MTAIFITLLVLLGLGFLAVVVDGTLATATGSIGYLTAVTRLPGPALSAQYMEPRCRAYGDFSSTIFPDIRGINYLDFVYVH